MLPNCFVVAIVACFFPIVIGVDPLLSLPGNAHNLVFVDIHTQYNTSGTCEHPIWANFLMVQGMVWKHQQQNNSNGFIVYDTCGSGSRVLKILQELYIGNQDTSPGRTVAGIISYTKPEITEVISDSVRLYGTLHVALGALGPGDTGTNMYRKSLNVDMTSSLRISTLLKILDEFEWSYITTVSDNDSVSMLEHDLFVSAARHTDVCIQYSQTSQSASKINMADLKTPGVVIFANDQEYLKEIAEQLSESTSAIVITHNAEPTFALFKNGVFISDYFNTWADFAKYISEDMWRLNTTSNATVDFYQNQYGCTRNTSNDLLACPNTTEIYARVLRTSVGLSMNLLSNAYDLVTMATEEMTNKNCSDFLWKSCLNVDLLRSSKFSMNTRGDLELDNATLSVSRVHDNVLVQTSTFILSDATGFARDVTTWLSNLSLPFPNSQCTGWCPSCQSMSCDLNQQIKYAESYYVIPGDVLLLGMFPLSGTWNENGGGQCSGVPVQMNTDVLAEAFLYAIRSARIRYQGLLTNVSVGALVLDTCSNPRRALQLLMNFESCLYDFAPVGNIWQPSPYITPATLAFVMHQHKSAMTGNVGQNKLGLIVDNLGNINQGKDIIYDATVYNFEAIVKLLHEMQWSHVGIVRSKTIERFHESELYALTKAMNICISYNIQISSTGSMYDIISGSSANTVILFATAEDVNSFFRGLSSRKVIKTYIIIETRADMLDITDFPLRRGTIFVKRNGNQNEDFNVHVETIYQKNSQNPWKRVFDTARENCTTCRFPDVISNSDTFAQASDVIKGVDISLSAMDGAYRSMCPELNGLCSRFWTDGANEVLQETSNVVLNYQEEKINLSDTHQNENYIIFNVQNSGLVEVGRWSNGQLTLNTEDIKSYNSLGIQLESPRESLCVIPCGVCVNFDNVTRNASVIKMVSDLDKEMGYKDSSSQFDKELWSIIVVVIAGSGSLLTILLMIYIMCKVCSGALVRRYLALGILLLVAMVFMFMSVLPFVFTPSESVCGMRFFAHGFSYAFCFAIILTKMTTLRDYRYIGLGGEISRVNQVLSVLFITGVQIAIGVEWWVLREHVLYSQNVFEEDSGQLTEKTFYACDFEREDFVAYHSFVIFLILLCCCYAICVRKETKNMKEARLLLVCSWFCLAIWIALIVTLMILERHLLEAVCAIGLLATALTMMVVIYLPKLTAISRLKYEVEQAGRKENGYKIDPDFQFERPYSLPGTMHSSITDKTLSYPRSLAQFDTSLSY